MWQYMFSLVCAMKENGEVILEKKVRIEELVGGL